MKEKTLHIDTSSIFIKIPIEIDFQIKNLFSVSKSMYFKLDTGASHTCLPALFLSDKLTPEICMENGSTKHEFKGIDGEPVEYYKIQLNHLSVFGMDFGSFPVYVTFDEKATKLLLGQDIIKFMDINICNSKNEITLSQTERFLYLKKVYNNYITNPELLDMDYEDHSEKEIENLEIQEDEYDR